MTMMFTLETAAALLFVFLPTTAGVVTSGILFGLTSMSMAGVIGAACGDRFGAALAPASLGFITLFAGAGQAVGPVIAGRMDDAFASFAPAYALSAGLFVGASVVAFLLRGSTKGDQTIPG
jgi:hypothetical protein